MVNIIVGSQGYTWCLAFANLGYYVYKVLLSGCHAGCMVPCRMIFAPRFYMEEINGTDHS